MEMILKNRIGENFYFGAFMIILIFTGMIANFVSAGENESVSEDIVSSGDEEVAELAGDSSGDEEVLDIDNDEKYEYVDIEEIFELDENETLVDAGFVEYEENESGFELNDSIDLNDSFENESGSLDFNENESLDLLENFSGGSEYVDIEEIVDIEDQVSFEDVSGEKILKELVKDGRVELEFEVLDGDNIEISKKEVRQNDFEKKVVVSSDEHFDDEVRVYSDLPSPAREEDVVVIWENEDEVVLGLDFFDEDGDGLVDRVSWVVPHLSTQRYSIEIVVSDSGGNSSGIVLNIDAPENNSNVTNPVFFDVNVDYANLSNLECFLQINGGNLYPFGENGENFSNISSIELSSGLKNWEISCYDKDDTSITKSITGYFNVWDFSIQGLDDFYFNGDDIEGTVFSQGNFSLKLIRGSVVNDVSTENSDFVIPASMISTPGTYELVATTDYYEENISVSESFSVASIGVSFPSDSEEGDNVNFNINIENVAGSLTYVLKAGSLGVGIGTDNSDKTISKSDFSSGNYSIRLENIYVNGIGYASMDFGTLEVTDSSGEAPKLELIYPEDDEEVNIDEIVFKYKVVDAGGIDNCSIEIYNDSGDDLIFPVSSADKNLALKKSITSGKEISLHLVDFDEGDYTWMVECFDNTGKSDWDIYSFTVDLNSSKSSKKEEANYARKDEIEDLVDKINGFLEKMDSFGPEERRVLEILGLDKDMALWKKKVVQDDQDLKFNLKFMEENRRLDRLEEIYEEIDEIEDSVILDIEMVDSYEFSKNSLDADLEKVIEDYFEAEKIDFGGSFKSLVKYNEELQGDLVVDARAWKLSLEYLDGTREIVLVSKNIDVKNDEESLILEVMKDKMEPVFVSEVENVGNNIYSVDARDLKDGNLVYYFEKGFALKEVEEMESILFGEGSSGGFEITGMVVGVTDKISFSSFFWLPLILFIGYFGFLAVGRIKLEAWSRKEPGVEEIVRIINETSRLIRENKVDQARSNYVRMGEIYRALPVKCRDYFYKEIKRIRLSIDKKDVLNLIREYEKAKDEFRREDAVNLHGKINAIYKSLPKKFQEKVYRRLVKKEV